MGIGQCFGKQTARYRTSALCIASQYASEIVASSSTIRIRCMLDNMKRTAQYSSLEKKYIITHILLHLYCYLVSYIKLETQAIHNGLAK